MQQQLLEQMQAELEKVAADAELAKHETVESMRTELTARVKEVEKAKAHEMEKMQTQIQSAEQKASEAEQSKSELLTQMQEKLHEVRVASQVDSCLTCRSKS